MRTTVSKIVDAIAKVGPTNYSLISRMNKIPESTVRYNVNKLADMGVLVQPAVAYEKLGFERYWAFFEFGDKYKGRESVLFQMMNEKAYLVYFTRLLPQGKYVAILAVPTSVRAEYSRFISNMIDAGILKSCQMHELLWIRYPQMKTEYYDFEAKRWNIDWKALSKATPNVAEPRSEELALQKADLIDLLIIKEIQANAIIPLTKIASKLKINSKTAYYHYRNHILGKKFIRNYIVRWRGFGKRRYVTIPIKFWYTGLTGPELMQVQKTFNSIPLMWTDAISKDRSTYFAELAAPNEQLQDLLWFIWQSTESFASKVNSGFADSPFGLGYTVPYQMYSHGEWKFDAEKAVNNMKLVLAEKKK
ncbi:MAG: hypothetical protein HYU02_07865 [Thaumarchaeota archaeon]|nr:hypothetical protein [Nitrososphaerota archaeon]